MLAFAYGQVVRWISRGGDDAYWSTLMAGIDGTVLLADPRPIDMPHEDAALSDYASMAAPDRAE